MNDKVGSTLLDIKIFNSELKVLVCRSALALCDSNVQPAGVQIGFR